MVVLNRRSTPCQAARAMEDNHIGAVLVSEPPELVGIVPITIRAGGAWRRTGSQSHVLA
jgi:hypothetical protein